jgi:hypothetical protein
MIRFALTCDRGHDFDAWFGSGDSYDEQIEAHAVTCPCCGSAKVRKAPMAPAVRRSQPAPAESPPASERKKTYAFLKGLRAHLEANAEHVGPAFPEEARKMHYGETEARSIYGEASLEEAKALHEGAFPPCRSLRCPRTIIDMDATDAWASHSRGNVLFGALRVEIGPRCPGNASKDPYL